MMVVAAAVVWLLLFVLLVSSAVFVRFVLVLCLMRLWILLLQLVFAIVCAIDPL